jgi:hypothetical protein
MLVPYQLPQFGIVIIPQMVCKKRGKKKKRKKRGKTSPTSLSLCNWKLVIMISLNNHIPRFLRF